jgi:hypothetical protein
MKKYLKILAAVFLVAFLGLATKDFLSFHEERTNHYRLTITGEITPERFVEAREHLEGAATARKTVFISSGGGNGYAALAIGILMRKHNWDVEVVDLCVSSCAIFIFPAGKKKYLNDNAILAFHGGPYQENMLEFARKFDQEVAVNGEPVNELIMGQDGKEGTIRYTPNTSPSAAEQELKKFLSIADVATRVERIVELRSGIDRFYQELGINPLLPTYGQIGRYEPLYKSYKYSGFIYRLDSLGRLGISNIELKNGEWHPERHPAYKEFYEVTYP